jgi:hypothetical protein
MHGNILNFSTAYAVHNTTYFYEDTFIVCAHYVCIHVQQLRRGCELSRRHFSNIIIIFFNWTFVNSARCHNERVGKCYINFIPCHQINKGFHRNIILYT